MSDEPKGPNDSEDRDTFYFGGQKKKVNWIQVRSHYFLNHDLSLSQLAEKFGISKTTMFKRAQRENWREERHKAYNDNQEVLKDKIGDTIIEARVRHTKVTGKVIEIIDELTEAIKEHGFVKADGSEITSTMTKVEIVNVLAQAAMKASEADRLNLGLKPGDTSETEGKETALEIIQRTLVPKKVEINDSGRAVEQKAQEASVAV